MLKSNNKYSNKLVKFIQNTNTNPVIKSNNENTSNTTSALNKIFDACSNAINDTQNKVHKIELLDSGIIKACHDKNELPLSYILFKNLAKANILGKITESTTESLIDFVDLETFINWHREYSNAINFEKLHSIMESNDLNKLVILGIDLDELVNAYKLLFRTSGRRKILHDAIYDNGFVSLDVQYNMETSDLEYSHYKIDDKHDIKIFAPITVARGDLVNAPDIHMIATLIDVIARIQNDPSVRVNLVIAYSSQKKNVYPGTKVLCSDNINSGSTYPGISITCWRKEEFYKVLLHELVHYYNIDFHGVDKFYEDALKALKVPEIEGRDMLNESYTETLTIIIMVVFSQLQQKKLGLLDSLERYTILGIKTEVAFIMFQIAKILTIFGADTFDDYVTKKVVIFQSTSFRSYFVIKCLLLLNFANTLEFMNKDINVHDERIIDFVHLINKSWESLLRDETNIKIINDFMIKIKGVYKENKGKDSDDLKWIYRTCRMSVNGPIDLDMI